ncbi:unnamed protein product, partial [Rotaria magnacalcarata]
STPHQTTNGNSIKRPAPITNYNSNPAIARPKKYQQQQQQQQHYVLTTKRNSTINASDIASTARSYTLPRSVTTDQITNNNNSAKHNNRLYYYPSVQDVLDALNRRSFDKESFV